MNFTKTTLVAPHEYYEYEFKYKGVDCKVHLSKNGKNPKPWEWTARIRNFRATGTLANQVVKRHIDEALQHCAQHVINIMHENVGT